MVPGTPIYTIERDAETGCYYVTTLICKSCTRNGWITWVPGDPGIELIHGRSSIYMRSIPDDYYPTLNEAIFYALTHVHSTHWAEDVPKILEAFRQAVHNRVHYALLQD